MAAPIKRQVILQKYYVYDPGVTAGDELGGALVRIDEDEKGNYILAAPLTVQWWIDQGLLGAEPVASLSGEGKAALAQFTRGRSEDPFETPTRVPRYSRAVQSGAPSYAQKSAVSLRLKRNAKKARQDGKGRSGKKPERTKQEAPSRPQQYVGPAE